MLLESCSSREITNRFAIYVRVLVISLSQACDRKILIPYPLSVPRPFPHSFCHCYALIFYFLSTTYCVITDAPPLTQIKRQLHRTSTDQFDLSLDHFRASTVAGAAALRERLGSIDATVARAAADAESANRAVAEGATSDRTRAHKSKAREEKEAVAAAAVAAAEASTAAAAKKRSRKGGEKAAREAAAATPWYGKYAVMEENALTLPEVPKVAVDEAWADWVDDGRRSSSRNVSRVLGCSGGWWEKRLAREGGKEGAREGGREMIIAVGCTGFDDDRWDRERGADGTFPSLAVSFIELENTCEEGLVRDHNVQFSSSLFE